MVMQMTMHFPIRDNMIFLLLASQQLLALAQSDDAEPADPVVSTPRAAINGTVEYDSFCRTCPYNICTHLFVPRNDEVYELTCWAKYAIKNSTLVAARDDKLTGASGDVVGDSDLWCRWYLLTRWRS